MVTGFCEFDWGECVWCDWCASVVLCYLANE